MNVYTTLLATDNYVDAVLTLDYSLRQVHSAYPLVVICYDSLSKETMQKLDDNHISYQVFPAMMFTGVSAHDTRDYSCTMGKFLAYVLQDVKRFVFIDADSCVLANIDWMFDVPLPIFFFLDAALPGAEHRDVLPPIGLMQRPDSVTGCIFSDFCDPNKFKYAESCQSKYGEDEQILIELCRHYQHLRVDYRIWTGVYDLVVFHEAAYGFEHKFWNRENFSISEFYKTMQRWREERYNYQNY